MVKGSCLCGSFAYEFEGEPHAYVSCHCIPCQKTAGTSASSNLMIADRQFTILSGDLKQYTRKGDSGQDVTYNMCATCGSIVFVEAAAIAGQKIVKAGTVDDRPFLDALGQPEAEIYTKNRWAWEQPVEGAAQKTTS